MIFATLGTHEAPFDRLIAALGTLPRDEPLVVQHGASPPAPSWATCVEFLSYEQVAAYVRAARVVIAHAGVGSIMIALAHEQRPVVVPRLQHFGEHVDDHQLSLGRRLDALGLVTLVEDPGLLAAAVARASASRVRLPPAHRLPDELRRYLAAEVDAAAPAAAVPT